MRSGHRSIVEGGAQKYILHVMVRAGLVVPPDTHPLPPPPPPAGITGTMQSLRLFGVGMGFNAKLLSPTGGTVARLL